MISSLVGLIVHNSMIYFFYRILVLDLFKKHVAPFQIPDSINMGFILLGGYVLSFILTILFVKYLDNYGFVTGFNFGVLVGILIGYGDIVVLNGLSKLFDVKILFINSLWYLLLYGTIGGCIGFSLKKLNSIVTIT